MMVYATFKPHLSLTKQGVSLLEEKQWESPNILWVNKEAFKLICKCTIYVVKSKNKASNEGKEKEHMTFHVNTCSGNRQKESRKDVKKLRN